MSAKEAGSDPLQRSLEKSVLRKAPADSPPRGRKAVNAPAAAAEEEHVEAREVREGPEGSEAPHERDEALGSSVDEEVTAAAEAAVAEDDVPEVVVEEEAAALTEAAAAGEPSGEQASAGERQQSASPPPAVTTYRVPKEATQGGRLHTLRLYVVATMISFGFQFFLYFFLVAAYLAVFGSPWQRQAAFTALAIVFAGLLPVKKYQSNLKLRKGRIMTDLAAFFDMECSVEEPLKGHPEKHFMLAQYPHGIFPMAPLLSAYFIEDVIEDQPVYCGIATSIFLVPFFRYLFNRLGGVPASRSCIKEIRGMGASVSIVVGGVAEMFTACDEAEVVLLRSGFIREAVRNGFDIVPVFHFGNSLIFRHLRLPLVDRVLEFVSRRLFVPMIIYVGHYGYPVPGRIKLKMVIGRPIKVNQQDPPSPEEVQRLYGLFKHELARIYRQHRPEWEKRELVLLEKNVTVKDSSSDGSGGDSSTSSSGSSTTSGSKDSRGDGGSEEPEGDDKQNKGE